MFGCGCLGSDVARPNMTTSAPSIIINPDGCFSCCDGLTDFSVEHVGTKNKKCSYLYPVQNLDKFFQFKVQNLDKFGHNPSDMNTKHRTMPVA